MGPFHSDHQLYTSASIELSKYIDPLRPGNKIDNGPMDLFNNLVQKYSADGGKT